MICRACTRLLALYCSLLVASCELRTLQITLVKIDESPRTLVPGTCRTELRSRICSQLVAGRYSGKDASVVQPNPDVVDELGRTVGMIDGPSKPERT